MKPESKTLLPLVLYLLTTLCGCAPSRSVSETPDPERAAFQSRRESVVKTLTKSGVTVEPSDPDAPYTLRVLLPGNFTAYQARKIAQTSYEALGEKAIVYVYDDTRKRLAKASQFGVE